MKKQIKTYEKHIKIFEKHIKAYEKNIKHMNSYGIWALGPKF